MAFLSLPLSSVARPPAARSLALLHSFAHPLADLTRFADLSQQDEQLSNSSSASEPTAEQEDPASHLLVLTFELPRWWAHDAKHSQANSPSLSSSSLLIQRAADTTHHTIRQTSKTTSRMDIRRLLHNPDDGGWFVIGETKSEAEMNDFRRSLKRNAIINTHLVNCTMNHENAGDASSSNTEHKMKVQWTKCTSALCHPKGQDGDDDDEGDQDSDGSGDSNNQQQHTSTTANNTNRKSRVAACPVQLRMSTCQLTFVGIVCQAYQHLSEEHDSAEPLQSCVTEDMKTHIVRMLQANRDVKPMVIFKELLKIHRQGAFGADLMPTKIQLRNALTYLRSRKLKLDDGGSAGNRSSSNNTNSNDSSSRSSLSPSTSSSRKRTFDSFSEGSASPPCDEHRQPE